MIFGGNGVKSILLTGGTGLLGGAVLHAALSNPDRHDDRWICLVRARNEELGKMRLGERLARFCGRDQASRLLERVEVVAGDVTSADSLDHRSLEDVTHVLHLAADTSWWGSANVARTNHAGTLCLAHRALGMRRLERFLHVSTAMICGANPPDLVVEEDYPSKKVVHLVSYSQSKALAEMSLARDLPGLPLVIARPSIVVGHTVLGAKPSSSILWVFRAGDQLRLIGCDLDGTVDVVPSDWTADTLLSLLGRPQLRHRVYHLSAGLGSRSSWADLGQAFEAANPAGGRRVYERWRQDETQLLRSRFKERFGLSSSAHVIMLRAMQAYFRFAELKVTFSNERLLSEGFKAPPRLVDYLPICLSGSTDVVSQFSDDMDMFRDDSIETTKRASVSPVSSLRRDSQLLPVAAVA